MKLLDLLKEEGNGKQDKFEKFVSYIKKKYPIGERIVLPPFQTDFRTKIIDFTLTIKSIDILSIENKHYLIQVNIHFHYAKDIYTVEDFVTSVELSTRTDKINIEEAFDLYLKRFAQYFNCEGRIITKVVN